jgi:hypothetical protein
MINYDKLRELDYVFTTSKSPVSNIIRKQTSGVWNNQDIATHVGILVKIKDKFFIAEMIGKISFIDKGRLEINSLKRKYSGKDFFENKIVCIKRNPIYYKDNIREQTAKEIISDFFETIHYDWNGIKAYIWKKYKQNPLDFYCSEYVNNFAIRDGRGILKDYVSPFEMQISGLTDEVDWKLK